MNGRVLLLSRDQAVGMNIARHISERNWDVRSTTEEQTAYTVLKEEPVDVVIMVLKRLEKDCLRIIKQISRILPAVEIVTINNSNEVKLSIKCMKAGVFDDMYPPLDMDLLVRRISEAAEAKKQSMRTARKKLSRFDRMMLAISFAEAGDPDTAKTYLQKKSKGKNNG